MTYKYHVTFRGSRYEQEKLCNFLRGEYRPFDFNNIVKVPTSLCIDTYGFIVTHLEKLKQMGHTGRELRDILRETKTLPLSSNKEIGTQTHYRQYTSYLENIINFGYPTDISFKKHHWGCVTNSSNAVLLADEALFEVKDTELCLPIFSHLSKHFPEISFIVECSNGEPRDMQIIEYYSGLAVQQAKGLLSANALREKLYNISIDKNEDPLWERLKL